MGQSLALHSTAGETEAHRIAEATWDSRLSSGLFWKMRDQAAASQSWGSWGTPGVVQPQLSLGRPLADTSVPSKGPSLSGVLITM